jgi:hypothetical protein
MAYDPNEDFSIFSRSAAREPQAVEAPRPGSEAAPAQAAVAVQQEPASCLIAGPVNSGKSAFLSVVCDACAGDPTDNLILKVTPEEEMARLIAARDRRRTERAGIDASTNNLEYRFSLSAERTRRSIRRSIEFLGVKRFTYMDGPGGALFPSDPEALGAVTSEHHRGLIARGRSAETLVFFLNVMADDTRAFVSTNLVQLMTELSVEMSVPSAPLGTAPGIDGVPLASWLRRSTPSPTAPRAPVYTTVRKISASRVLLVLNFIDQLCVRWQQQWRSDGDERGDLSPLEIAREYVRPLEIAEQLLGRMYLRQIVPFLRPEAKLAVGLCSCGGFDTISGDPCLDEGGHPNLPNNLPPKLRDQHAVYFGVREILLYAGFDILTPGIVEEVSQEFLYD